MHAVSWAHCGGPDEDHPDPGGQAHGRSAETGGEDLTYRVEVWDEAGEGPELVVAITATPALAYAAYYAAAREFAGRDVTLKHRGATLSHWRTRMS
jgi:hypothetical protein